MAGLASGCKKQGGEKKAEGDEGMKARGMRAMAAMEAEGGMEAMEAEGGMEAMGPDRPTAERPREEAAPEDKKAVAEGVVTEVKGTVEVRRAGKEEFEAVAKDAQVFAKDAIRVGKDGEATLALWDNSTVELPPESAVTVNPSDAIKDPAPSVTVMAGAARFDVNPRTEGQGPFAIFTPSSVVNVQGTTLAVGVGLSGASRVAVEEGKVELVPVAKVEGKPLELPQGKVVVVAFGQAPAAPAAYQAANAGWDEWLEAEDKKAADKAGELAGTYADQVDTLQKDGEALDQASQTNADEGVKLAAEAAAAEKANDTKAYAVVQPRIAAILEAQAATRDQRMLVDSRMVAQAYLLGLMRARIRAGVYKVPPAALQRVDTAYERGHRLAELRRAHALKRYQFERNNMRGWQAAYYTHHPRGRMMAPKLKVEVPAFYAKAKLRAALRPAPVRVAGWNRPLYRRPEYRGKYRPYRPHPVAAARPGEKRHTMPEFRQAAWQNQEQWRKARAARLAQQAPRREAWRKAVIQRRAQRWGMRPDARAFHGMRRPGPQGEPPDAMGPHGRGPGMRDPGDMGPDHRGPMMREPDDMGPGHRGPMLRDPEGMGPHGRGPKMRDPHDRGPMAGMPVLDEIRRRRMERRNMGPGNR